MKRRNKSGIDIEPGAVVDATGVVIGTGIAGVGSGMVAYAAIKESAEQLGLSSENSGPPEGAVGMLGCVVGAVLGGQMVLRGAGNLLRRL